MKKELVLVIARNYKNGLSNGGNEVTKRNIEILKNKYFVDEFLIDYKVSILEKLKDTIFLNSLGFNKKMKKELRDKLIMNNYSGIWIDNSLYGTIAKYIKRDFNSLKISSFFHNVEYKYFLEKMKVEGILNFFMLPYAFMNERRLIKYSDKIIVLNSRDEQIIYKVYKRKVDMILPLTLKDKYRIYDSKEIENKKIIALFVGSNFFANTFGIKWFVNNVLPSIDVELRIVGQGMDKLKVELENLNSKVKVLGFVDDIRVEYENSNFVIAPIFHGSGMKTKTTEALMFGKTIFGTSEAFVGFDLDYEAVGGLCDSKENFIKKINEFNGKKINEYSRRIYLEKYSNESLNNNLEMLFGEKI